MKSDQDEFTLRMCETEDIDKIHQLIQGSPYVLSHTPVTYWLLFHYFKGMSYVMEHGGNIIGYIFSFKGTTDIIDVTKKDVAYLWQIFVADEFRGKGLSQLLIEKAVAGARESGCKKLQLSINPENAASLGCSESYANAHDLSTTFCGHLEFVHEDLYEWTL